MDGRGKKIYTFLKDVGGVLKDGTSALMDILIPRTCAICGRTLNAGEKHLCIYCEADMPLTYYWERKKNPMADKVNAITQRHFEARLQEDEASPGNEHNEGGHPLTQPPKYSFAAALFFYHGENKYKRIPQRLKYLGDIDIGRFYAEMLGEFLRGSEAFKDIDLVIPVPLHWARRRKRGYNQAEIIAETIAGVFGVPTRTDILIRKKSTQTQTKLDIEAKNKNVSDAFAIREKFHIIKNRGSDSPVSAQPKMPRHILLVDDVFTTGSTLAACINVLQPYLGTSVRISCATLGFVSHG